MGFFRQKNQNIQETRYVLNNDINIVLKQILKVYKYMITTILNMENISNNSVIL